MPGDSSGDQILESIRDELLGEATRSPALLADLANLERYIAETYSARSFVELLQNADDAQAKRFRVARQGDYLVCANDGLPFSRQDFYSLCRSASSNKQRGATIGYRGIGFKSVVGVAESVHLISDSLRATFSRALTGAALGNTAPAPLVRIPHPLALAESDPIMTVIGQLHEEGFTTVFVLAGLDAERVQEEFDQFDADYLLFLHHVCEATLDGLNRSYRCERQAISETERRVRIDGGDRKSYWSIEHHEKCDLAFSLADGKRTPLKAADAIAHAYLPTLEQTGYGIRINADFSTDPSRTRIVFDDMTYACIDDAAAAIAAKISAAVLNPGTATDTLACLTPTVDLATLALQKRSFRTELISRTRERLNHLKETARLAPAWLSQSDAAILAKATGSTIVVPDGNEREGQVSFMRYLGIKALPSESIIEAAGDAQLGAKSYAPLIAQAAKSVGIGIAPRRLADSPLWIGAGSTQATRLDDLIQAGKPLDLQFVEALGREGLAPNQLARLLTTAGLNAGAIGVLLPGTVQGAAAPDGQMNASPHGATADALAGQAQVFDPLFRDGNASTQSRCASPTPITSRSLPAWRGAEEYVALVLRQYEYQVEDRSRQNLGYDIYAEKDGRKYYVEVKLLDYAGQPFVMTTNEEAVARECGASYALALTVRSTGGAVHVQFIHDPARALKLTRQCRQWVWECSDYDFQPQIAQGE
jgi:hypothetical protein